MAFAPADAETEANAGLLFLTARGDGWAANINDRAITHECRKLLDDLGIKGRNFYTVRRTFETIAGESLDQPAVDAIMGHDDGSMANVYRQRMTAERLQDVADFVRSWLFAMPQVEAKPQLKIAVEADSDGAATASA